MDREAAPPIAPGWDTASTLVSGRGGNLHIWQERMETLRDKLVAYCKREKKMLPDMAKSLVNAHYVGEREKMGRIVLAIGPKALPWLEDYRWLSEGWMTGSALAKQHGGQEKTWNARIMQLKKSLEDDIVASGAMEEAEARPFVSKHFAGKRNQLHSVASPAISEEGRRWLPIYPKMDGWKTGSVLQAERGGSSRRWNEHIEALHDEQIDNRMKTLGEDYEAAAGYVEAHIAGKRQPADGAASWAVSAEGEAIVAARYIFKPKASPSAGKA